MNKTINIGIIIADDNEFEPTAHFAQKYGGKSCTLFRKKGYQFSMSKGERTLHITVLLSGIGKVNAAACAAFMSTLQPNYIISTGLSGGIAHIGKGEITLGSVLVEHDFDLTPLGYEKGVKPGQDFIYKADGALNRLYTEVFPDIKIGGIVTGDCFISDDRLREELAEKYEAMSCDMESAAVASVCHDFDIGFAAVRKVSDNAGAEAHADYQCAKGVMEQPLLDIVFGGIEHILDKDEFWNEIN